MTIPSISGTGNSDYRWLVAKALCLLKERKPDQAIATFQQALAILPDHAQFDHHYYLGIAFQQAGQLEKAVNCYRQALEINPNSDETYLALASCLQARSDYHSAEQCYRHVLRKNPFHPKAAFSLGTLYLQQNDTDKALKWLLRARDTKPDWGLLQNNLGRAFLLKNDKDRAFECFQKARQETPEQAEIWFNLAELYTKTDQCELAVSHYRKAIQLDPSIIAAHNNMGIVLMRLERYQQAIVAFEEVVSRRPNLAEGHLNLGNTYRLAKQLDKAIIHLSKAVQLRPTDANSWNDQALACKNRGDLDRALSCLNRAIHIDADLAIAHWNRAFIHLLRGDWLKGWQDFEWRFQIPQWQTIYPHRIKGIPWTGDVMPDHTILIHDEQGLGDTFQFVRYLNWVKQCFGKVILETRKELVSLLSNCSCIDQIIARSPDGPPPVPFDRYAPLMSLPRIFQTTPDRVPGTNAYIAAPKEKLDQWRNRLPSKGFKVGLVWAGRPEHVNDANRSCTLDQISALFQLQEIEFFGLQKGPAADQASHPSSWPNFSNLGAALEDFADTAGILAHLDLVITVDTSVAHLAGAMSRPVWVLIPFIPDWRWMTNTERSPWYPTMRLFRQARPDAWEPVIAQIKAALIDRYHKRVTCHDRKAAH